MSRQRTLAAFLALILLGAVWFLVYSEQGSSVPLLPDYEAVPPSDTTSAAPSEPTPPSKQLPATAQATHIAASSTPTEAPRRKGLPTWESLPPAPALNLRPSHGSDSGLPSEDELAALRNTIAVRRFQVTISGTVSPMPDKPVKVWAVNLPSSQMDYYEDDKGLSQATQSQVWPDANPVGGTTTDVSGAFTLQLSVTGADRQQMLDAVHGEVDERRDEVFIARVLLRAEGENVWSVGLPVRKLTESQVLTDVVLPLLDSPQLKLRIEYPPGKPAASAVVWFSYGTPKDNVQMGLVAYTDSHGVATITFTPDAQLSVTVWIGQRSFRVVQAGVSAPEKERPMVLKEVRPGSIVLLRLELEGQPEAVSNSIGLTPKYFGPGLVSGQNLRRLAGTDFWMFTGDINAGDEYQVWAAGFGVYTLTMPYVAPGMTLEVGTVVLPKGRDARLIIVDRDGQPLAGVDARLEVSDPDGRYRSVRMPFHASDAYGDLDIHVLPGRHYRVNLSHPDRADFQLPEMSFADAGPHLVVWPR